MKNSYPVQIPKYEVQRHITGDFACAWWIQHVLAKRNRIIGKPNSNYWFWTEKFGVNIPTQCKTQRHLTRKMQILFGGTSYAKKLITSDLNLRFERKTYHSCCQDIKILHVIWYFMYICAKFLEEKRDLLQTGTRILPQRRCLTRQWCPDSQFGLHWK